MSQLHTRALQKMREKLGKYLGITSQIQDNMVCRGKKNEWLFSTGDHAKRHRHQSGLQPTDGGTAKRHDVRETILTDRKNSIRRSCKSMTL
ncbi:hypothetical protein [Butyrivibrio sp. FCS014]|uniref:hypothetical protein n=1 Tax=Butyrivibrio sp. FCS014 TaxID=1408304 RepID=UPI002FE505EE